MNVLLTGNNIDADNPLFGPQNGNKDMGSETVICRHILYEWGWVIVFIYYNIVALYIITGFCTWNNAKQHTYLIKLQCRSGSMFNCRVFGAGSRGLVMVAQRLKQSAKWSIPMSGWFRSLLSPTVINRMRRESMTVPALYCSLRFMCQSRKWLYISDCWGNQCWRELRYMHRHTLAHSCNKKRASVKAIHIKLISH